MSVLKQYNQATSQWEAVVLGKQGPSGTVAVTSPLINTGTSTAGVIGLDYSALQTGQNLLINGGFEIWQRGTSHTITTSAFYTADRWYASGSGGSTSCTISKQTSGSPYGIGSHARIAYNTNSAFLNIFSAFESAEVARMAGKTVTISFKARRNASFTGGINFTISTGTVADSLVSGTWTEIAAASISNANLPTGTTSNDWYTQSATVLIPANAVALRMRVGEDTFQPSGAYIEFTGLKVEFGSTATPFSRAGGTIQGELSACQRYCVVYGGNQVYERLAMGSSDQTTSMRVSVILPVKMRSTPTMSVNTLSDWQAVLPGIIGVPLTGLGLSTTESSPLIAALNGSFSSNGNYGSSKAGFICGNGNLNGRITLEAEL